MISIVVVGRNDTHGYNLQKRISTSLNSLGSMLSKDDEIIFVDWNTPLGYPVMPVSIQDDLLPKTKDLLKIVRVPPSLHDRILNGSSRVLIEPIARNAGIRRVSKKSSWVLSTNTDIIMASPLGKSLGAICESLDKTLWQSFRFEIPEFMWEQLDRREPSENAELIISLHAKGLLPKRITVNDSHDSEFEIPDGVGDFQLAPKEIWDLITGFPEEMVKGWHVDTRFTIQASKSCLIKPAILSESDLIIFHQNHLRNSTSYHESTESNSLEIIMEPYKNKESWGLIDEPLVETLILRDLRTSKEIGSIMESFILEPSLRKVSLDDIHRRLDFDLPHTLNFLCDELTLLPKNAIIHCFTQNLATLHALTSLAKLFFLDIYFREVGDLDLTIEEQRVDLLILDFGISSTNTIYSAQHSGEVTTKMQNVGVIAYAIPEIAKKYLPFNPRVACIRNQNWPVRGLSRTFFLLPLFNNYTSLLCGTIKNSSRKEILKVYLFRSGIVADYGLSKEIIKNAWSQLEPSVGTRVLILAQKLLPLLPEYCRKQIRTRLKKSIFGV